MLPVTTFSRKNLPWLHFALAAAVVAALKLSPPPVGICGVRVRVIFDFLVTSLTETLRFVQSSNCKESPG